MFIILGYPASGKTTVGKELQKLGYKVLHVDEEIVKTVKMPISEFIKKKGIKKFRNLEEKIIKNNFCRTTYNAIVCGGGFTGENISSYFNTKILLDISYKESKKRIKNDPTRPIQHFSRRKYRYKIKIDATKPIEYVVKEIEKIIKERYIK